MKIFQAFNVWALVFYGQYKRLQKYTLVPMLTNTLTNDSFLLLLPITLEQDLLQDKSQNLFI